MIRQGLYVRRSEGGEKRRLSISVDGKGDRGKSDVEKKQGAVESKENNRISEILMGAML